MWIFSQGTNKQINDLLESLEQEELDHFMDLMGYCQVCGESSSKISDIYVTPEGPMCISCYDDQELYSLFFGENDFFA